MKGSNKPMGGWLKDIIFDYSWMISLVISGLIASLGNENVLRLARIDVGIAMVGMSGALLGIVLAGLAIFVAFLDKKYVKLLEQIFGMEANLMPFKWTAIIAILCVGIGMGLIVLGEPSVNIFRLIFGIALWVFIYLLWQIYELVKFLAEHAKARVMQIQKDEKDNNKP
jgi:hypothetical protein